MNIKHGMIAAVLIGLVNGVFSAPATWTQPITYNGLTVTMQLTKETLRGTNFVLWAQNGSGGYDVITPVAERSYIGTVDGYPGAVSCGILQDNGVFKGAVYFDRGETWFSVGTSVVETRALGYGNFSDFQLPTTPTVEAGQAGSTMYGFEVGVDVDYNSFTSAGSSVATAFERIEYSICLVRAIYMRDVLLRPYLGRVIVRSTLAHDPYTGTSGNSYLAALKAEWENNHTDTDPDVVCGSSPTKISGGLAFVGVVGGTGAYAVNQSNGSGNFDVVYRHELGHNWDCGHNVGGSPEGTGIMGGNAPARFSGCEVYRILNHRTVKAGAGIIDPEGTYTAIELPPYASMDVVTFVQALTPTLEINVLANDHDANGQALSLHSFDGTTAKGGTITQLGQNLVYTPQGELTGFDYFMYTVTDTTGKTAEGVAMITVAPNDPLRLYLPLDETSGTTAVNYSEFNNNGTVSTDLSGLSIAGPFGNAVNLDGVDNRIEVPGVQLAGDTVTLTAWVRQGAGATQNDFAGIIFDRSVGAVGLHVGNDGELRYTWNSNQWQWNPGLTPPVDSWTFVALVVEPTKATIYMNPGTGFQTAVNTTSHGVGAFDTTYIGWDPNNASRHFKGAIDDVRMYNYALSPTQLQNVYSGGGAESPDPLDGAVEVTSRTLGWLPGAVALSNEVYVGTSEAAVAAATKASPEYKGSTADSRFKATLASATTYYWRVDTVTASGTLPGTVWSFTTGAIVNRDSILVNFQRNADEVFAGGQFIGPLLEDSSNWNSVIGASGADSNLIDNDGNATPVTISWSSATTWSNADGTGDDEHKLATGYLDDGDIGGGKGATVTLSNIPYQEYRVYGLFASDQNASGSTEIVNVNVNGTWALGGNAATTASAWGSIGANQAANGEPWTEIVPVYSQGNYWTVTTSGSTCSIVSEDRNSSRRGSLTAVIIEDMSAVLTTNAPTWNSDPVSKPAAALGVAYSGSLLTDATDLDGDTLTFTKVSSDPAWLIVAPNGDLSGTPSGADAGSNSWTVAVTDGITTPVEATLEIEVETVVASMFSDDFERTDGTTIGNGWIEQANDSRIYDTGQAATKMVIHASSASTPFAVVNQLGATYVAGGRYELTWNAAKATAATGTLNYNVSLGTWNGAVFTPLSTETGSIAGLNDSSKKAGPSVYRTASAADAGQPIAFRFEVLAGSGDWVGFDDVTVNLLGLVSSPDISLGGPAGTGYDITMSWVGEVGVAYGVQTNADLVDGIWGTYLSGLMGDGGAITFTNDIDEAGMFFRIIVE